MAPEKKGAGVLWNIWNVRRRRGSALVQKETRIHCTGFIAECVRNN